MSPPYPYDPQPEPVERRRAITIALWPRCGAGGRCFGVTRSLAARTVERATGGWGHANGVRIASG